MPDDIEVLRAALDQRSVRQAPIAWAVYQRPLGNSGLHVVTHRCNPEEIVVGSSSGQTYAPGATVPLGSNNGTPGSFIIGAAPPGQGGASHLPQIFPTPLAVRGPAASPSTATVCPLPVLGRSYLALWCTSSHLIARTYLDGTPGASAGSFDHAGAISGAFGEGAFLTSRRLVVCLATISGDPVYLIWPAGGGEPLTASPVPDGSSAPVVIGESGYAWARVGDTVQAYRFPLAGGSVTAFGDPLALAGPSDFATGQAIGLGSRPSEIYAFATTGVARLTGSRWARLPDMPNPNDAAGAVGDPIPEIVPRWGNRMVFGATAWDPVTNLSAPLMPASWPLGLQRLAARAVTASGDLVAYRAELPGEEDDPRRLVRISLGSTFSADCPINSFVVAPSPDGRPARMFPL